MAPTYGVTSAQTVFPPELALDLTSAVLDGRVTFTRSGNTATVVNSSGDVVLINADLPRFDYNPLTLACKGLLIEESRINTFQYSEDFSNAFWIKTGMLAFGSGSVVDAITSPDGTIDADLLTENTSAGNHVIATNLAFNFVSGTYYTQSYFVKANGRTKFQTGFRSMWFTNSAVNFDLVAKTATVVAGSTASTAGSITEFKNGWFRLTHTAQATATGSSPSDTFFYLADASGSISYTGDGTSGAYVWGAQLEVGEFPTSYIPNLSNSTTTRNVDVATMTGTDFSGWYNQSKGTFRTDFISIANGNRPVISADDNTANESLIIKTQGNVPTFEIVDGGTPQASVVAGTVSANTSSFAYVSYDTDYFGIARPTARQVDTSGTIPTPDRLRIGANQAGNYFNGHVQTIEFWP